MFEPKTLEGLMALYDRACVTWNASNLLRERERLKRTDHEFETYARELVEQERGDLTTAYMCGSENAKDAFEKRIAELELWDQEAFTNNRNAQARIAELETAVHHEAACVEAAKAKIAELADEVLEQARLNGMGSEREASLMAQLAERERAVGAKQAEIDRLMLEHCPNEMTATQLAEWGRHQRVAELEDMLRELTCKDGRERDITIILDNKTVEIPAAIAALGVKP